MSKNAQYIVVVSLCVALSLTIVWLGGGFSAGAPREMPSRPCPEMARWLAVSLAAVSRDLDNTCRERDWLEEKAKSLGWDSGAEPIPGAPPPPEPRPASLGALP